MRRIFRHPAFRNLLSILLFLFFLGLGAAAARAETLQKYREDIEYINDALFTLYSPASNDLNKERNRLDLERDFFEQVSLRLPPRETVEWEGLTIEGDNRWLHKRLEDLKKIPAHNADADLIITELSERLIALKTKLAELDTLPAATRSKDEEKQKLFQILNRAEYQAPEKKDKSALERWWEAFIKWISSLFPKPAPVEPTAPLLIPGIAPAIVQILIIGLAIAAIAFVIWRFAPYFQNRRRKKKDKKETGDRIILGEKLAANESSATLFRQAELLAQEGNFRGAIRKGYIALLCELGDRRVVRLAQHKTNRDYLRDVSKNRELHHGVSDLTFMFENHWYGLESATEEEWGAFRENYRYSTSKI